MIVNCDDDDDSDVFRLIVMPYGIQKRCHKSLGMCCAEEKWTSYAKVADYCMQYSVVRNIVEWL